MHTRWTKNDDTSYKSAAYFGVVLKADTYNDYHAIYVGDRLMVFSHPVHEEIRVYINSCTWMEDAWAAFLLLADSKPARN